MGELREGEGREARAVREGKVVRTEWRSEPSSLVILSISMRARMRSRSASSSWRLSRCWRCDLRAACVRHAA